jgi:hypothetical protein
MLHGRSLVAPGRYRASCALPLAVLLLAGCPDRPGISPDGGAASGDLGGGGDARPQDPDAGSDARRSADGDRPSVLQAYEGYGCSVDPGDNPLYVCATTPPLICISTYGVQVANPDLAQRWDGGVRPVYHCRLACADEQSNACPEPGDVCCRGARGGGGSAHGCVPAARCATGARDAGPDVSRP